MTRCMILSGLLAGVLVIPSTADENKRDEKKVEIHFLNGSIVRLAVQSATLEVATRYGKLTVPVEEIRSIEFGLHMPEGFAAKIDRAVKQLGDASYRERESGGKTLVELGPYSYPAVLTASRGKDLETATRAREILKKLQAAHPRKDLKTSTEDKLMTPGFTVVGRILTPSIKVQEEYFGEATLGLAKMRSLRALTGKFKAVELAVDASKYGTAGQWLETGFRSDGITAFVITAKGQVDLAPQQGGQLVGPAGLQARKARGGFGAAGGGGFGGAGGAGGAGGGFGGAGGAGGGFPPGAAIPARFAGVLFGKIGENGEPFIIGERYEGTPETAGKLFLHIAPGPFNGGASGSYQVTIGPKD
jgi:hypothetical protein